MIPSSSSSSSSSPIQQKKITSEDVIATNEQRQLHCTVQTWTWGMTELQKNALSLCEENNQLRQLILIHPALVFDKKLVKGKQFDPGVGRI